MLYSEESLILQRGTFGNYGLPDFSDNFNVFMHFYYRIKRG
jgi:hypothetical protein